MYSRLQWLPLLSTYAAIRLRSESGWSLPHCHRSIGFSQMVLAITRVIPSTEALTG